MHGVCDFIFSKYKYTAEPFLLAIAVANMFFLVEFFYMDRMME